MFFKSLCLFPVFVYGGCEEKFNPSARERRAGRDEGSAHLRVPFALNHTPWLVIINIKRCLEFVLPFRYHCGSLSKDCDGSKDGDEITEFRVYKDEIQS